MEMSLFRSNRKDDIERLRRDIGHAQRSTAVPQTTKSMSQQDIDFVRIHSSRQTKFDSNFFVLPL